MDSLRDVRDSPVRLDMGTEYHAKHHCLQRQPRSGSPSRLTGDWFHHHRSPSFWPGKRHTSSLNRTHLAGYHSILQFHFLPPHTPQVPFPSRPQAPTFPSIDRLELVRHYRGVSTTYPLDTPSLH